MREEARFEQFEGPPDGRVVAQGDQVQAQALEEMKDSAMFVLVSKRKTPTDEGDIFGSLLATGPLLDVIEFLADAVTYFGKAVQGHVAQMPPDLQSYYAHVLQGGARIERE
jgi:hypothetical protein